jgi:hypothetical protein
MNVKIFGIIAAATLGLFILSAVLNGIFGFDQKIVDPQIKTAAQVIYFILFLILCFSVVPLFIKLFITGQIKIGNGEVALIKLLRENEKVVVYGIWTFMVIGLSMAIPAAIKDGFFK